MAHADEIAKAYQETRAAAEAQSERGERMQREHEASRLERAHEAWRLENDLAMAKLVRYGSPSLVLDMALPGLLIPASLADQPKTVEALAERLREMSTDLAAGKLPALPWWPEVDTTPAPPAPDTGPSLVHGSGPGMYTG